MPNTPPISSANVVSLHSTRQRRYYINLANANEAWQEIKASWELEGIKVTDDNAFRAGRMLAGEVTLLQVIQEIRSHQE